MTPKTTKETGRHTNMDLSHILTKIENLETRIKILENENIGLTNALYELENSLEAKSWAHPESSLSKWYSLGSK